MEKLKKLIPYLAKYKTKLYLGFLFVTISNLCATYAPRLVGRSVDIIESGNFQQSEINELILYIILLTAGSGFFMFLTRRMIIVTSRIIEYELRRDFLFAIEQQPAEFFHSNSTGDLMAHTTNDIKAAREFIGPAIMYSANTITSFIFALYFMLSLNVEITLLALLPLPLIALAVYLIGKRVHVAFKNVQEKFSDLTTQAQEAFSGTRIVRAYNREEFENEKFIEQSNVYLNKNLRLARLQTLTMPLLMVLIGLSLLIALWIGGGMVIEGKATLGDLTQFFIYLGLLIWPVAAIGWVTNIIQRAAASMGRLSKIFDLVPSIRSGDDEKDINSTKIEFKNVSLKYESSENLVIDNLNLNVDHGTSLGIIGTIGSGKTSLVNLIPRLYDTSEGDILIDNTPIREIPLEQLRSLIGVVSQEPFLFSMTIKDNILFGAADAGEEDIEKALRVASLQDDIESFPDGLDTILGERGITLSGGQKQRVSIARAIIKDPKILILDDALSAVDTKTESIILSNLNEYMQDRTSIIIAHRISSVMNADKIIVMDKGRIIEEGRHEELLSLDGTYARMYNMQKLEEEIELL